MIKVFFLVFQPAAAWEKIARARRGHAYIWITNLLPILLLVTVAESWGLEHWGKWQPKFQIIKSFTPHEAVFFEICQFFVLLATVLICSLLILRVNQTFHERIKYLETFTLTAYAFSPLLLLQLLNVAPAMSPWAPWAVGVGLMVWILYQGVPRVLQPDPTHAFGAYLSTTFIMVMTSGLERLITAMYLLGYMDFQHSWLTREISRFLQK